MDHRWILYKKRAAVVKDSTKRIPKTIQEIDLSALLFIRRLMIKRSVPPLARGGGADHGMACFKTASVDLALKYGTYGKPSRQKDRRS